MVILAVDLGTKRTGLAVCDAGELLASPVGTVHEAAGRRRLATVAAAARERGAELIVVGLPRNMDGSKGEAARNAEEFARQLEIRAKIPVTLWDERLTTVSAEAALRGNEVRGPKRKELVDTVAAVMILEDYLRYRKKEKRGGAEL